jgi:siroheme synthase-like protein
MPREPLYPVFLKLSGLPVVVVGGGTVAASKLDGLLAAGARVTVVAPTISDAIRARGVTIIEAPFRPAHLSGARWVVAAATPVVNREVADAAAARGLFVNAVDDTAAATAYLGGVVRRGEVEIAISTGGIAPALAGLVREALDAVLPRELEKWVDVARAARDDWKAARVPIEQRRPLLLRALDRLYARHEVRSNSDDGPPLADAPKIVAPFSAAEASTIGNRYPSAEAAAVDGRDPFGPATVDDRRSAEASTVDNRYPSEPKAVDNQYPSAAASTVDNRYPSAEVRP